MSWYRVFSVLLIAAVAFLVGSPNAAGNPTSTKRSQATVQTSVPTTPSQAKTPAQKRLKPAVQPPTQSAIASATARACSAIASRTSHALVVGEPLQSDITAPRAAQLVERVVSLVSGCLGPLSKAETSLMPLVQARAAAAPFPHLAFVQTRITAGVLQITIDLYPVAKTIWDRAVSEQPGAIAFGFGTARIDAHVRTFLSPIRLISRTPRKIPMSDPTVLALGCDDIDGDGALELVLVSRQVITTARVVHGVLTPIKQVPWNQISPISPSPWRQPFASVATEHKRVWVGCTDRAQSAALDENLGVVATFSTMPVVTFDGIRCVQPRLGSFSTDVSRCLNGRDDTDSSLTPSVSAAFPFDASAAATSIDPHGTLRSVWAVRNPTDASLDLRDNLGARHIVFNVGAQITIGDIDQDGDIDIITSKNVLVPTKDAIVMRSWRANGSVEKRWEIPVQTGIQAVAACPADSDEQNTIAVATSNSVWFL